MAGELGGMAISVAPIRKAAQMARYGNRSRCFRSGRLQELLAAASIMMHPSQEGLNIIYPLLFDNSSSVKELALSSAKTREVLFPLLFDESQLLRTRAAGIFLASVYQ